MKDDTLERFDALLHKHRGDAAFDAATPEPDELIAPAGSRRPPGWLPVLTDLVERGQTPETASAAPSAPAGPDAAALAEQLMDELAPRIAELVDSHVAAVLRDQLDATATSLLARLDAPLRALVREAIADRLDRPGPG